MGKRHRRRLRQTAQLTETAWSEAIDDAGDGTRTIRIITPGWGSSGYWSESVLANDGPQAFPAGTHMYFDHPTATESVERPERSLRDLAAVLVEDASWQPHHSEGAGLYAKAQVFEAWQPVIDELAPHIGVSVRATGPHHFGEAEGRKGRIIDGITEGLSVDFVTRAGRGGKILELVEAARAAVDEATVEEDWSHGEIRELLNSELQGLYQGDKRFIWVRDVGDDWVVWEDYGADSPDAGFYRAGYSIDDDGQVTVGDPEKVVGRTVYETAPDQPTPASGGDQPQEEATVALTDQDKKDLAELFAEAAKPLVEAIAGAKPHEESGSKADDGDGDGAMSEGERKAREQLLLVTARDAARSAFAGDLAETARVLPQVTIDRLVESAAKDAPHDDQLDLDRDKLVEGLKAAAEQAVAEFAAASGAGRVTGMGGTPLAEGDTDKAAELEAEFTRMGLSESAAKTAAAGR